LGFRVKDAGLRGYAPLLKAHRLVYHSTPGSRVIKKKKKKKKKYRCFQSPPGVVDAGESQ